MVARPDRIPSDQPAYPDSARRAAAPRGRRAERGGPPSTTASVETHLEKYMLLLLLYMYRAVVVDGERVARFGPW